MVFHKVFITVKNGFHASLPADFLKLVLIECLKLTVPLTQESSNDADGQGAGPQGAIAITKDNLHVLELLKTPMGTSANYTLTKKATPKKAKRGAPPPLPAETFSNTVELVEGAVDPPDAPEESHADRDTRE
eukprot:456056-Alexandrium_andersonii.AAC.1